MISRRMVGWVWLESREFRDIAPMSILPCFRTLVTVSKMFKFNGIIFY